MNANARRMPAINLHQATFLVVFFLGFLAWNVGTQAAPHGPRPSIETAGFDLFWPKFREAALADDQERIQAMTSFPFKGKSGFSGSKPVLYDKASFAGLWAKLLEQDSGAGGGLTMRDYLKARETSVPGDVAGNGKRARMGTFEFEKTEQGWRLTGYFLAP